MAAYCLTDAATVGPHAGLPGSAPAHTAALRDARTAATTHLTHAGLPLPAQDGRLLLEFLHLLGMGCSGFLQLGPEVSKLRCQGVQCVLKWPGSSHLVLPWAQHPPLHCPTLALTAPPRGLPHLRALELISTLVVSPVWVELRPPPSVGSSEGGQTFHMTRTSALTGPSKPCWFPLGPRSRWAAYLPGPVPAGSGHLASAAPSPERWRPDCAWFPSTSPTGPSSQTPSGTRPRQGQGWQALAWLSSLLAFRWCSQQAARRGGPGRRRLMAVALC